MMKMNKLEFRNMFSQFCNDEIKNGRCEEYDCSFCVVNKAYEYIFADKTCEVVDAVKKVLQQYDAANIDVLRNTITDMIDIVYHSRNNSFAVKEGIAYYCDVDIDMLEDRLDELGVGYGWF